MKKQIRYMKIYKPHQTEEEMWQERALELRYSGPNCDQIPFGDEAFDAMDSYYADYERDYRYEWQWHIFCDSLEYQIEIYEQYGLVPRDQDIEPTKPTKERERVCFPWQGVTVYTRH